MILKKGRTICWCGTGLALLLLLWLTSCTTSTTMQSTASDELDLTATTTISPTLSRGFNTLRLINWQNAQLLNPHLSFSTQDLIASRITYEPLASFDKDNHLIPFLAADIPTHENGGLSDDGRSVTWKLKEGVKWCDGTDFTASDVAFTYEFVSNPQVDSSSAELYESIDHIEVLDDYTVRVHFLKPNPAWDIPFVGIRGIILPRHVFASYNGENALDAPANTRPVGTGPYCFVSVQPQETLFLGTDLVNTNKIVYEPNPFFREPGKPFFRKVELRGGGAQEVASRFVFEEGTADYAFNLQKITPEDLEHVQANGEGRVLQNFGPTILLLDINHVDPISKTEGITRPHPFLSDPIVREALSYAINREAIADLFGLAGEATSNVLLLPEQYRSPNTTYAYDPDKARALLDAAGWIDTDNDQIRDKDGKPMTVLYKAVADEVVNAIQELIKEDLEAIGMDVDIRPIDASIFFGDPTHPDFITAFQSDLQSYVIASDSRDPGSLMSFWTCQSGFNLGGWCSEEYDRLYEQSTSELDPEKRRALFIQMNDLIIENNVLIPLVHQAEISGASVSLEGVDLTPWDVDVWNIKDWKRK